MPSLVYDAAKEAVNKTLPLGKSIRKVHKKITDAAAEVEMSFGPDNKIAGLIAEAELKLRASAELADSASEDLITVLHQLGGAVPKDGAQIKLFKLEEGGFRIVVENDNPPADSNSETSTSPGGHGKPDDVKAREAALADGSISRGDPAQLDIETEARTDGSISKPPSGDTLPDAPVAFDESVIMAANEIKPQLTAKQRDLIHRIGKHDHVSPDDLDRGEKASIRSLIGRKLVREADNRYSLNDVAWRIVEMIDEDNTVTKAQKEEG